MSEEENSPGTKTRKPRLALMGEFSAGKSTLTNLLLGADPLPVRVTATRLPPVWISYGENEASRQDLDGVSHPIDINHLDAVQLEETSLIRLSLKSDVLRICDLIDMPGISDPNMDSDVWEAIIGEADNVIWCTHATQAWRQSEAAVWDGLPEHLREKSLLLLTRFDKIRSDRDQERVLARVRRETKGLFSDLFPISLTEALVAGVNRDAWVESGAEAFVKRLIDLLMKPHEASHDTYADDAQMNFAKPEQVEPEQEPTVRVMPSRVRLKSGGKKRPRGAAPTDTISSDSQPLEEIPRNA